MGFSWIEIFLHSFGLPGRWFSGSAVSEEIPYELGKPVLRQPPVSQSVSGFLDGGVFLDHPIHGVMYSNFIVSFKMNTTGFKALFYHILVHRPLWWITSSIHAEINSKEIGVVHRLWHLWKRVYDLYLGNKQFAEVGNPGFWNWTFTLKDINGEVLAEIDRDWSGFSFEIFTDAGQYVICFRNADSRSKTGPARVIQELEVACPLTLLDRGVTVALAISLDNNYFSRHGDR
ncbi:hypothetical protein Patl1_24553 [Pistacia atlantica]|uniref:Uncharacterized protein n=1 Tax=Pistacia atlantica TaxID=434234 RepID=A0ACC0ZZ23_9ROSI|nr:hypothetical protein Patl1_24553 [Pistacia atlantica]